VNGCHVLAIYAIKEIHAVEELGFNYMAVTESEA